MVFSSSVVGVIEVGLGFVTGADLDGTDFLAAGLVVPAALPAAVPLAVAALGTAAFAGAAFGATGAVAGGVWAIKTTGSNISNLHIRLG